MRHRGPMLHNSCRRALSALTFLTVSAFIFTTGFASTPPASAEVHATAHADTSHGVPRACHPVHVVQAAGTYFSSREESLNTRSLVFDLWDPALSLQETFGAAAVSATNVAYPASLGRFSAFQPGSEGSTYGESVAIGTEWAQKELEDVAAWCPTTRFVIIGYSQGASVAGDLAARISAHQVAGVDPAQVAGVLLIADPGRSQSPTPGAPRPAAAATTLWGPVPEGEMAANGEIINGGNTGVLSGREGLTGARAGDFHNLHGKVLSLCHSNDLACSTPPDSLFTNLGRQAGRVQWLGPVDNFSGAAAMELANSFPHLTPALLWRTLLHIPSLLAIVDELTQFYSVFRAQVPPQLSQEQFLALGLAHALPKVAYELAMNDYLVMAAGAAEQAAGDGPWGQWVQVVAEATRAVSATEALYWQLFHEGLVPQATTPEQARQYAAYSLALEAGRSIARQAGVEDLLTAPDYRGIGESFSVAGDFAFAHQAYFERGFYVHGQLGSRYADAWLADIVRGALSGHPTQAVL